MRYDRAQRTYFLFWDGGPTPVNTLDRTLVLKPFARVGDTWGSPFTDYGVTTTLVSRGTQQLDGVTDSVATFRLNTGATVVLSKNYGLVSAPSDLLFGMPNPRMLTLARRPLPAGQSYYNPLTLLDLQPGNELGYYREPLIYSAFPCYSGWLLRRVLTRQLTADSIIYTFQQQRKLTYSTAPGCFGTGIPLSPLELVRVAASRRTGKWAGANNPNSALLPVNTDLLSYEYRSVANNPTALLMGFPVVTTLSSNACSPTPMLRQQLLYRTQSGSYNDYPAIDLAGWTQILGVGVGLIDQFEQRLTYFRRTVNGVEQTCGNRSDFATLLPARLAQLAPRFQAFPNPATDMLQLRLEAPAQPGTSVIVHDALGRLVWQAAVPAGQTAMPVSLRGKPAGIYQVQLQTTEGSVPGPSVRVQKLP
ncbi:T9SS type A sorting domain-containing protein [Hymenobacter cellulosilyticus]|uniref:T9SS type A sorting domain-containing protein n=1 Tax=Hymenobacter cellulosilyticus TaxID=2932248 RepID=A0A8T9Q9W7_9BACT|nr:T9SS type A sorting domain-containing protein [Hymenobacter cellulosilyticus]UOQ74356.1 T9SS type A sorting domain-containing protein [Hymenobacter cellulosilyticus]